MGRLEQLLQGSIRMVEWEEVWFICVYSCACERGPLYVRHCVWLVCNCGSSRFLDLTFTSVLFLLTGPTQFCSSGNFLGV